MHGTPTKNMKMSLALCHAASSDVLCFDCT